MSIERYCIVCGEKIEECMGYILARDFIDFLNKKRNNIREICGKDVLRLSIDIEDEGINLEAYLKNLLEK
jgi:hypothetical protein